MTVARLGHVHLARTMLSLGTVQVDAMDSLGRTALWTSVESRRPMLVSLLLSAGCRLDILPAGCVSSGCVSSGSALHLAIRSSGYISGQEIAFLLIKAGADLWHKDCENRTPLGWAVYVNNCELVEELLLLGSNPWKVSRKVMETAGKEVTTLVNIFKKRVPRLQELAGRSIRRAMTRSVVKTGLSFVGKFNSLPLPTKLIDFLT